MVKASIMGLKQIQEEILSLDYVYDMNIIVYNFLSESFKALVPPFQ